MPYLFDTDALSEVMRREPNATYLEWLRGVPREDQFTSAVSMGELFQGARRSPRHAVIMGLIEQVVLPAVTVLPFDLATARVFGELQAELETRGASPGDADVQIAATAVHHNLRLVTGNVRHHSRVPGLQLEMILASSRKPGPGDTTK